MAFAKHIVPRYVAVLCLAAIVSPRVESLKLRVPSQQRECVQEVATEVGQTITGSFVADASDEANAHAQANNLFRSQDRFDMTVVDPTMKTVYTTRRKVDHRFEVPVEAVGTYTFCFFNQARSATHVLYNAHVGHHVDHKRALAHHLDPLTESVQNVKDNIGKLKQEYKYQHAREVVHRRTNESTSHRLVLFSALEAIALIACSVVQVYYIQSQFAAKERRGVV